MTDAPRTAGLLLAAGAGRRFGRPKALVDGWVADRVAALRGGGCSPVVVVLGAAAQQARGLVPPSARTVVAENWSEGMGASLRIGLVALAEEAVDGALVALVDTPGLTAEAVARLLAADDGGSGLDTSHRLAQATYDGEPGHPVLLGRAHWEGVMTVARGDRGARDHLARHHVVRVECGDVASGEDVDTPAG